MVMFGISMECRYENLNLGCSIGMLFKYEFGFVGFLVKLNVILENFVISFFIVVYVVI